MSDQTPLAPYWSRTLRQFLGRPVLVILIDGRRREGMLSGSDGRFRVWTEEGPASIPLGSIASVEAV